MHPKTRPGLARLLATLHPRQGERITLYVRDRERFARHEDPRIVVRLEDTLRRRGIDVVYLSDEPRTTGPGSIDLFEGWSMLLERRSMRPRARQRRRRTPRRNDHR